MFLKLYKWCQMAQSITYHQEAYCSGRVGKRNLGNLGLSYLPIPYLPIPEVYLKQSRNPTMELFAKIVNG